VHPPAGDHLTPFRETVSAFEVRASEAASQLEKRRAEIELVTADLHSQYRVAFAEFQAEKIEIEDQIAAVGEFAGNRPTDREMQLAEKVAAQRGEIQKLRDELDRLRVEVPKRKPLLGLQAKRRETLASLEDAKSNRLRELTELINELSQALKEQRVKSAVVIAEASGQLEAALDERTHVMKDIEEAAIASVRKWRDLRCEIGSAVLTLDGRPSRQSPVVGTRVSLPVLPPLKGQ
jgi:DNA repair exonuclease SbcCD ATPase subunit